MLLTSRINQGKEICEKSAKQSKKLRKGCTVDVYLYKLPGTASKYTDEIFTVSSLSKCHESTIFSKTKTYQIKIILFQMKVQENQKPKSSWNLQPQKNCLHPYSSE